jgi:hypothetical protein
MANLARRIAPAAALGGLAVVIVGVLDPALAAGSLSASEATPIPVARAPASKRRSSSRQKRATQPSP